MFKRNPVRARLAAALGLVLLAGPAMASMPSGDAAAWDLSVKLNLIGLSALDVDAQSQASIAGATTSTSDQDEATSLSLSDALGLIELDTGLLKSEVAYAAGGKAISAARAEVNDLDLSVATALGSVLSLRGGPIVSQSVVAGSCPPPQAGLAGLLDDYVFEDGFDLGTGLAPVEGGIGDEPGASPGSGIDLGDLVVGLIGTDVPLPLDIPPNTEIDLPALGIAGVRLILNERVISGDGIQHLGMLTNALRLELNVLNLISGQVILAHSEASLSCP